MVDESRCHNARAAGERLVLDATFVGANRKRTVLANLDEVCVGTFWREMRVVAERRPKFFDIRPVKVLAKNDGVWDASVEEVNIEGLLRNTHRHLKRQAVRFTHPQLNVFPDQSRCDNAGERVEDNDVRHAKQLCAEAREASGSIPTHLCLTAVGVEVAHPKVRARLLRELGGDEAVRAYPSVAVAEVGDDFRSQFKTPIAVVDHDKVVPSTVHFCKIQHTRVSLNKIQRQIPTENRLFKKRLGVF